MFDREAAKQKALQFREDMISILLFLEEVGEGGQMDVEFARLEFKELLDKTGQRFDFGFQTPFALLERLKYLILTRPIVRGSNTVHNGAMITVEGRRWLFENL